MHAYPWLTLLNMTDFIFFLLNQNRIKLSFETCMSVVLAANFIPRLFLDQGIPRVRLYELVHIYHADSQYIFLKPTVRGKEFDFGSARLSFLTICFDESEILYKDTLRQHACSSSVLQTVDDDYSNFEVRSCLIASYDSGAHLSV